MITIDEYIKIKNCEIYKDYYGNDFLWQRIREGTRREIRYYSSQFPDRFELVGGISLGRYDFGSSSFIIPEQYQLDKAGVLEMPVKDAFDGLCRKSYGVQNFLFPPYVKLTVDNPFSLVRIPVSPDDAIPLIERLSKYNYRNINDDRLAVMRIRVRISDIRNYKPSKTSPELVFKGQLDEIALFEDPGMRKLIWKKTFKELE
mgnify:CR=1 FL=1